MLTRSRTTVLAATALVLAAGLAGCTASGAATVKLDPLSEYLAVDQGDADAQQKKSQELIKKCMEQQGFEYTIETPSAADGSVSSSTSTRSWVEKHGYGVVESTLQEAGKPPDPNTTYLASLPEQQRHAYRAALDGAGQAGMDPGGGDWQDQGCTGKADHEFSPDTRDGRPPIIDKAWAYRTSLIAGPEITKIDDEWATCMRKAGYPDYVQRLIVRGVLIDAKLQAYLAAHPDATFSDPGVAKIHDDEVAVALADWDCADEMHYDTRLYATLAELEKDYIAEHKGELEEAKLWLNNK